MNVNVNLMVENVILIENLITIHADVSVKMRRTIMRTKKIIFGVLLNSKYVGSIYIDNSMITCDEIIETTKSTSTKTFLTKTIPKEKKNTSTSFYILLSF